MITSLVFYSLIGLQAILKVSISWNDGTPSGLQAFIFIWTFVLAGFLIMGELKKPAPILIYYPLFLSRIIRGITMILLVLPNTANEFFTIFLCIVIGLYAIFCIWFGRKNPAIAQILSPNEPKSDVEI